MTLCGTLQAMLKIRNHSQTADDTVMLFLFLYLREHKSTQSNSSQHLTLQGLKEKKIIHHFEHDLSPKYSVQNTENAFKEEMKFYLKSAEFYSGYIRLNIYFQGVLPNFSFCNKSVIFKFYFSYLRVDSKWLLQMNSPFLTYI